MTDTRRTMMLRSTTFIRSIDRGWRLVLAAALVVCVASACSVGSLPGEGESDPWDNHNGSVFTMCGGAGVSSGDGVRAFQCYGPMESSGAVPTGETSNGKTVEWRPGAMRVVTP